MRKLILIIALTSASPVSAQPWTRVKDWNFGEGITAANFNNEFLTHDQFGGYGSQLGYGALATAQSAATALTGQPVDPTTREFTPTTLRLHVKPLSSSQTQVGPTADKAGYHATAKSGSFMAAYSLPADRGGKDLMWQTRMRMVCPVPLGYWHAIWTAGESWHTGVGPEMDVMETFTGAPGSGLQDGAAWHSNSVGGRDKVDYSGSWWAGMKVADPNVASLNLCQWHTWTWIYYKDSTYIVMIDGKVAQRGGLTWKDPVAGVSPHLWFLFDFTWGFSGVWPNNSQTAPVKADGTVMTYEIDWSQVYLR